MSDDAVRLHQPPLLWEQHCCLPLSPTADVGQLLRYRRPGGSYVSVNAGYVPQSADDVSRLLTNWRERIAADLRFRLAETVHDIDAAGQAGQVSVAFDLEDSGPLGGRLERVRQFYELGVRSMLPSYNHANAAGGGCLDEVDEGLTAYGRALIREMNAVGMVGDGSHCGARTGLDMCEVSEHPVIYSHSCMRAVWDHPRNITDEQARASAATGGVVGITGVGIFLGPNDASIDALIRHIDYAVDLIGPDHVGVSTDFPFDHEDFNAQIRDSPHLFPDSYTRWGPINFISPETLLTVESSLRSRGYSDEAVTAILGGNFRRVAMQVWA